MNNSGITDRKEHIHQSQMLGLWLGISWQPELKHIGEYTAVLW